MRPSRECRFGHEEGTGKLALRVAIQARSVRLLNRLPRLTAYGWAELLLIAAIAVQAARLTWILVTPLTPVGDYRAAVPPAPSASALAGFDPFFRTASPGGAVAVTGLALKLHGVREDRSTGRGSAIIALPDGTQLNFVVGEEIMAGVILSAVGFDHVTISRQGTPEQLFLDQSQQAPATGTSPSVAPPPPAPAPMIAPPLSAAPPAPATPGDPIRLQTGGGGVQVSAGTGGSAALRAAGLVEGDVIVSVNGQQITSAEQARTLARQAGAGAMVLVNRGGRIVPIRARLN